MVLWLYDRRWSRPSSGSSEKFGASAAVADANARALKAGYNFGETTEMFRVRYEVPQGRDPAGTYRASRATRRPRSGS